MSNQRKAVLLFRLAVIFIFACVLILFVAAAITSARDNTPIDDDDARVAPAGVSALIC